MSSASASPTGRQQPLDNGGQGFFLDLLVNHRRLRRFIVIDLKIGEYETEFAGKMAEVGRPSRSST